MSFSLADLAGFSGLLLAVYTAYLQRKHNFKSLMPIAQIRFYDYEDCVAVRIVNAGLGPMTIENFNAVNENVIKHNLIDWMPPHPQSISWETYYEELKGVTILPNEEAKVLVLKVDEVENSEYVQFRDKVRASLSMLEAEVIYRDVYGRRMPKYTRSLNWFGRDKPKQRIRNLN
ncbi:MAG: hypothetical protein CVU29_07175 [Betaproteobacteria bacterium HGW-Betaproteobacteria-22]|nr:MAG: hypothetical protein CVU29_07175 [Betaproteobacteria bacterium HGW-Betaproteobacteria-22]